MSTFVSGERDIISALSRVDWNFPGATTLQSTVHSLHWFPGNFIPQIPSYLIQLLSKRNDWILDPFCGSGTTGIEAILLGRRAWQTDINRVSIMIARGKLAALSGNSVKDDLIRMAQELFWNLPFMSDSSGRNGEGSDPALRQWFHEDTLAQLRYIWNAIERKESLATKHVLEMIFSDALFACASTSSSLTSGGRRRRHHWGWIADNVRPRSPGWHNATKIFRDRLTHACDVLSMLPSISCPDSVLKREDIHSLGVPDSSMDLIVTSPPYLGMIDYALANRLTYLWFGWSLTEDRDLEIGARYRRKSKNVAQDYLQSVAQVSKQMVRVLKTGGHCAIVIGSSRKFQQMAELIATVFGEQLRLTWGPIKRIPTKRRISERKGTEPVELVCVFRKDYV